MDELLRLASSVQALGVGGAWTSTAAGLAHELGVQVQQGRSRIEPGFLLEIHDALSLRFRDELKKRYTFEQTRQAVRISPNVLDPEAIIVGLHGALDTGQRFCGLFAELLVKHPLELLCPTSGSAGWTDADGDRVVDLVREPRRARRPIFLVGLSTGANLALKLRPTLARALTGVVAIASAPWKAEPGSAAVPTLYVHGTADRVFDIKDLTAHVKRKGSADIHVVEVDGWGHGYPYRHLLRYAWPWMAKRGDLVDEAKGAP